MVSRVHLIVLNMTKCAETGSLSFFSGQIPCKEKNAHTQSKFSLIKYGVFYDAIRGNFCLHNFFYLIQCVWQQIMIDLLMKKIWMHTIIEIIQDNFMLP